MTESRAIELLEYIRETGNGEAPYVGCAQNIALNMAIQALEEIQQYRAIGTVEEILNVLENQRIIIVMQHETLKQYRELGTIEEFKDLKEKETEILLKDGQFLYQQGLVDGYAKAIDEFAEKMRTKIMCEIDDCADELDWIDEIAEQLKDGE